MAELTEPKNNDDYVTATSCDKRKLSPDVDPELTNATKKLKENIMQPNKLCDCPRNCSERVPQQSKDMFFKTIGEMGTINAQNEFLKMLIEAYPIGNRLLNSGTTTKGKLLRRIRCKYMIPLIASEDFTLSMNFNHVKDKESNFNETSPVESLDSKKENAYTSENDSTETSRESSPHNYVYVCQKAFLNVFGVSEQRLKAIRELLLNEARQKYIEDMTEKEEYLIELSLAQTLAQSCFPLLTTFGEEYGINVCDLLMTAIGNDINLVSNFFYNQLWKPEYLN